MAYIVDLTLVMEILFWIVAIYRVPLLRRPINLAFKSYKGSHAVAVHSEIQQYVERGTLIHCAQRGNVINQIVKVINHYHIGTADKFKPTVEMRHLISQWADQEIRDSHIILGS